MWIDGAAGFKPGGVEPPRMQCHYCDREAAVAVEKDLVKVGLCEDHFQDRLEELSDSGWLDELQGELDVDRSPSQDRPPTTPLPAGLALHPP